MAQPRWIPKSRTLVEVTTRTFQGRYFLKPTPEVREIILGVVGRAQRIYGMEICCMVCVSNHMHFLLLLTDVGQLARFMNYVNGQIPKKILPMIPDWDDKFWGSRFVPILVTDEPEAQLARFRYLLSHGVKEGLVERPEQWVGVNCVKAWLEGEPLRGYWFDKTREARARKLKKNRGKCFDRLAFADEEEVKLTPLPCWAGRTIEEIRAEIREMVEGIVEEWRVEQSGSGRRVLGTAAVLAKPWDFRPKKPKKSPRPLLHFRSAAAFELWRGALGDFLAAYHRASAIWRSGVSGVRFPEGCFPPSGGFSEEGQVGERRKTV